MGVQASANLTGTSPSRGKFPYNDQNSSLYGERMKTLSLSEAKAKLSGLIEDLERRDEEVMITRNGRPAAVLVSPEEYESWKETHAIYADRDLMREIRAGAAALDARKARLYTLAELLK